MKARGIRNNNPGNIRRGEQWQGMSQAQTDPSFIQFTDPVYGIRAINKILKTYSSVHGLNTVAGIISRWAPTNENDTESYILSVAESLKVDQNEQITLGRHARMLTAAIIRHENGIQPYDVATIDQGVRMAQA